MLLSHIKGKVEVLKVIGLLQSVVVQKVWAMAMDKGTEGQAILEAALCAVVEEEEKHFSHEIQPFTAPQTKKECSQLGWF